MNTDNHSAKLKEIAGKDGWKPYSGNPVMAPGKEGQWDAGAIGSMSVIKVKNTYHINSVRHEGCSVSISSSV